MKKPHKSKVNITFITKDLEKKERSVWSKSGAGEGRVLVEGQEINIPLGVLDDIRISNEQNRRFYIVDVIDYEFDYQIVVACNQLGDHWRQFFGLWEFTLIQK